MVLLLAVLLMFLVLLPVATSCREPPETGRGPLTDDMVPA